MQPPVVDFQILTADSGSALATGAHVRLAGRRADGRSVAVAVRGLYPFFYVKLAGGLLLPSGNPNVLVLEHLETALNDHLNRRVSADQKHGKAEDCGGGKLRYQLLRSVECVRAHDFYGYSAAQHHYAKLTFGSLGAHAEARWALTGLAGSAKRRPPLPAALLKKIFPGRDRDIDAAHAGAARVTRAGLELTLAEANIAFHDQVMDALNLKPGGWCRLDPALAPAAPRRGEACAVDEAYVARPFVGNVAEALQPVEVARAAPVRVLAWDLEVWCVPLGDGAMRFFNGDDPGAKLLCVSAVTFDYGVAGSTKSVVFSLGDAVYSNGAPVSVTQETATDGSPLEVRWFGADERGLMKAFFDYVRSVDPDVVTGWNTLSFDWPWLWKRAAALGVSLEALVRWDSPVFDESDKARQVVTLPGREVHDMMVWVKKNRQLREYNLQFVATEYGLSGKDDVSYSDIASLFETHEGRIKLAVYCALDSRLVVELMQLPQLDPLGKTLAIAAITGVMPEHVLHRGSMHTLRLAMLRASHAAGFVLSCPTRGTVEEEVVLSEEDEARFQV